MSFLSSFYPQPVVSGTTEGTFAEGNDSRIVGAIQSGGAAGGGLSGTYPNPTLAPIISTNSNTARSLQNRFTDVVNVLDFGADPTGTNDSWLAIQRALRAAAGAPNAAIETINDTELIYGINYPKLFFVANTKQVIFPKGNFKISRPIIVSQGTRIRGASSNGTLISPIITNNQSFNLIETQALVGLRDYVLTTTENTGATAYCAGLEIKNLRLEFPSNGPQNYLWYPIPWYTFNGITSEIEPADRPILRVNADSGAQGSTQIAVSTRFPSQPWWNITIGSKIKFSNHNTEYTVTATSTSYDSLTITPALTQSAADALVLYGVKACGIMVEGGENSLIEEVMVNNSSGVGIFITNGSPSTVVRNCMVNASQTAGYWFEASPVTVEKPSGDNNKTFIRAGWFNYISSLFINSVKIESQDVLGNLFEFGSQNAGGYSGSKYIITGGSVNCPPMYYTDDNAKNFAAIDVWNFLAPAATVICNGVSIGGYGEYFYRERFNFNGSIFKIYANAGTADRGNFNSIAGRPSFFDSDTLNDWIENPENLRFRLKDNLNGGIIGERHFGVIDYETTITRVGDIATFVTSQPTTLDVGDYVLISRYKNISPSGSVGLIASQLNGEDATGFSNRVLKIISKTNSTTFTCSVSTDGNPFTSATVVLSAFQVTWFHDLKGGEHRIQTPTMRGASNRQFRVLGLYNKLGAVQAGVRGYADNEWAFWSSRGYDIGGTWKDNTYTPLSTILAGTGAPSASAPNGSLYLRTDGDASTTLYVRAGGAWKPLSSYEA